MSAKKIDQVADRSIAFVLDASAVLAMLQDEPGGKMVETVLENSIMSSVNLCEVLQKSLAHGVEVQGMESDFRALGLAILPFTPEDAETAARLWPLTRRAGLSLGDRACLALAAKFSIPTLTADRAWGDLDIGIEVELLR